jgi:hypothetical protein
MGELSLSRLHQSLAAPSAPKGEMWTRRPDRHLQISTPSILTVLPVTCQFDVPPPAITTVGSRLRDIGRRRRLTQQVAAFADEFVQSIVRFSGWLLHTAYMMNVAVIGRSLMSSRGTRLIPPENRCEERQLSTTETKP